MTARSNRGAAALCAILLTLHPAFETTAGAGPQIGKDFQAMLAQVDAAQLELQNGKSDAFKALWSHADDITLSGGFGGTVEKGWAQIRARLDWGRRAVFKWNKHDRARRRERERRSALRRAARAH